MPYPRVERPDLPFYQPRFTPDTSRLQSIYGRGGEMLANLALQRGQNTAQGLARLASIISGAFEGVREDKAKKSALELRTREREEDKKYEAEQKRQEREERKAEREEATKQRNYEADRASARWAVDNTPAGPVDDAFAKFAARFPETAARLSRQMTLPARPVPGAMGEMSMAPEPTGQTVLQASPDDVRADQTLQAQRERWAAEDRRANVDDQRMADAQKATEEYQRGMLSVAQQNAASTALNAETTRRRYTTSGLDTEKINPSLATALDRAILTITPGKRKTIVELANRLAGEGNEKELKSVIKQAAIEGENVDTKNQVLGRQATAAALADARVLLSQMKKAGVPTNILTGTAEDIVRKLGATTDPRYVEFGTALQDSIIAYRRAATGVAFSERENADYTRMFPNYRQTMPVNEAAINGMLRAIGNHDRQYWEHKLGPEGAKLVIGDMGGGGAQADPLGIRR